LGASPPSHNELEERIEEVVDRYLPHNYLANRVICWPEDKRKMVQELYELIQHSSTRTSPLLIDNYSYESHSSPSSSTSSGFSPCSLLHSATSLIDARDAVQSSSIDRRAETAADTKIVYLQSMESLDDLFLATSSTEADSCVVLREETVKSFVKDQLREWLEMVSVSSAHRRQTLDTHMDTLLRGLAHAHSVSLQPANEESWSSTLYAWVAETILSFADGDHLDRFNKPEFRCAKRLLISAVQVASKLVEDHIYNVGIWELYNYCKQPSHSSLRKDWVLSQACKILGRGLGVVPKGQSNTARSRFHRYASKSSGKPADNRRAHH